MDQPCIKRERVDNKQGQDGNERTSLEHLSPDLIFLHIFPLLSVFSLLPLKLVCKSWHRLFHQYRECRDKIAGCVPREPNLLILGEDLLEVYFYDFNLGETKIKSPAENLRDCVDNVLSSNGLLCILPSPKHSRLQTCIYNPLTSVHHFLPYQPRKALHHHFGFGFHRGTNKYKVVGISETVFPGNNQVMNRVEVITVKKDGCWKSITKTPTVLFEDSSDVVADGSIHWFCKKGNSRGIVSFNLAKNKFSRIKPPILPHGSVLAVLGGCLALTDWGDLSDGLNIWTMDGATKLWTKKYNFMMDVGFVRPVCLLNNGDVVVSHDDTVLYVYRQSKRCFERVETCSLGEFKVVQYDPVL